MAGEDAAAQKPAPNPLPHRPDPSLVQLVEKGEKGERKPSVAEDEASPTADPAPEPEAPAMPDALPTSTDVELISSVERGLPDDTETR